MNYKRFYVCVVAVFLCLSINASQRLKNAQASFKEAQDNLFYAKKDYQDQLELYELIQKEISRIITELAKCKKSVCKKNLQKKLNLKQEDLKDVKQNIVDTRNTLEKAERFLQYAQESLNHQKRLSKYSNITLPGILEESEEDLAAARAEEIEAQRVASKPSTIDDWISDEDLF